MILTVLKNKNGRRSDLVLSNVPASGGFALYNLHTLAATSGYEWSLLTLIMNVQYDHGVCPVVAIVSNVECVSKQLLLLMRMMVRTCYQ